MRCSDLERPAHLWFDPPLTPTTEHPRRIERALSTVPSDGQRLVWTGGEPLESPEEGNHATRLNGELDRAVAPRSSEYSCGGDRCRSPEQRPP